MGSLYRIAAQRAQSYLELPEELPTRPAGYSGTSIVGGRLGTEYEHNVEWATPRARAKVVSKMLRTSSILALAEEYLSGRVTACKLHVPRQEGKSAEAAEAIERWLGIGEFEDAGGRLGSNMAIDDLLRHRKKLAFFKLVFSFAQITLNVRSGINYSTLRLSVSGFWLLVALWLTAAFGFASAFASLLTILTSICNDVLLQKKS